MIVGGCAGAIVMWWAAFFAHLPGVRLATGVIAVLTIAALVIGIGAVVRLLPPGKALVAGLGAGFIAAALNLPALGAGLATDTSGPIVVGEAAPAEGKPQVLPEVDDAKAGTSLRPGAVFMALGFLATGTLAGGIAGAGARLVSRPRPDDARHWLGRMAIVVAGATGLMIVLGGAVTSTESGMAVPDWPTSYGANMFLYPLSAMAHPRVFFEHTHRLYGSLVGLNVIVLCVMVWAIDRRMWAKIAATVLLGLVIVQGVLGGLRVSENSLPMAIVHGVLAQVFFGLLVAQAVWLSPAWANMGETARLPRVKRAATALVHTMVIQLALGAAARHLQGVSKGAMHALWTHVAFALAVMVLAAMVAGVAQSVAKDDPRRPMLARGGKALLVILVLQVLLGVGALMAVLHGQRDGGVPDAEAIRSGNAQQVPVVESLLATAHQGNGALMFGTAMFILTWSRRGAKLSSAPEGNSSPA